MTQSYGPILDQIVLELSKIAGSACKPMFVFDLDSTLFDVSPRLQKIIEDFGAHPEHTSLYPESIEALKNVQVLHTDWGIKDALIRAGLDKHPETFHVAIRDFWKQHFFSDHYVHFDSEIAGASKFVQDIFSMGASVAYLTGRDVQRMGKGSLEVLKKWNFPVDLPNAQLVLKPRKGMPDAKFKSDWFKTIDRKEHSPIWFFENEPENIHLVRDEHPDVQIIFLDTTHSGRAEPPVNLPIIKTFTPLNDKD